MAVSAACYMSGPLWVSVPEFVYELRPECYPRSVVEQNPYGSVLREHFRVPYQAMSALDPPVGREMPEAGMEAVRTLLASGAPIDVSLENGSTPLMWASWSGFENLVALLLAADADVSARTNGSVSALHCSLVFANAATTELLLEAGADVDAATGEGLTALMFAARRCNAPAVRVLLESGATLDLQDGAGMTALMHAANGDDWALRTEVVSSLLAAGADRNLRDHEGRTALSIARKRKNEEVTELLRGAATSRSRPGTTSQGR